MQHPKMRYPYVGIDSHKDTHTAVFLDCFFGKLGEIQFENIPARFDTFLSDAEKFKADGTEFLFGLEDVSMYGRTLAVFLREKNQQVKHTNASLVAQERKRSTVVQKTDSFDAECAAHVLLSKLDELPDADPQDMYWLLRTIVVRRRFITNNNIALRNHLHNLLTAHFPGYHKFFTDIACNTSLVLFAKYPSPHTLKDVTVEELAAFLWMPSNGRCKADKAQFILHTAWENGFTATGLQEIRDETVRSAIRQLRFNQEELERIQVTLAEVLAMFNTTLTSMTCIDVVTAAQLLSCIGDIRKFPTAAKLAQYAGIAPVIYASGKKDKQYANKRGDRELNSIFYAIAVRVSSVSGVKRIVLNHYFYEYYNRKLSEGKTKKQALKCVMRRLVNIIWTMLTKNVEYINPERRPAPEKSLDTGEKQE